MCVGEGKRIKHLGRNLGQQLMWRIINCSNYQAVVKFATPGFQLPQYILQRGGDFPCQKPALLVSCGGFYLVGWGLFKLLRKPSLVLSISR